jgi:hypothetical protein
MRTSDVDRIAEYLGPEVKRLTISKVRQWSGHGVVEIPRFAHGVNRVLRPLDL